MAHDPDPASPPTAEAPTVRAFFLERWLARLRDHLFGFDFFISYAHKDGKEYPEGLVEGLTERGYRVFLDESGEETGFVVGEELATAMDQRIRQSTKLILIAGESALRSQWVHKEVEISRDAKRVPVVIDLGQQFKSEGEDHPLRQILGNTITLFDPEEHVQPTYVPTRPSAHVFEKLEASFKATRKDVLRFRFFLGTAAALLLLIAGVVVIANWGARKSQEAEATRGDLVESNVEREEAKETATLTALENGLVLCEQGEVGEGLSRMAQGLSSLPEDAVDLEQVLRSNILAWSRRAPHLERVLPFSGPTAIHPNGGIAASGLGTEARL